MRRGTIYRALFARPDKPASPRSTWHSHGCEAIAPPSCTPGNANLQIGVFAPLHPHVEGAGGSQIDFPSSPKSNIGAWQRIRRQTQPGCRIPAVFRVRFLTFLSFPFEQIPTAHSNTEQISIDRVKDTMLH